MNENNKNQNDISPFLEFFRYFGIVLAIAVALMPLLTRFEDLLPMYAAQKEMLTFFASLACLLSLGFIFSIRRSISRLVFPLHSRAISAATMLKRLCFRYAIPICMITASVFFMAYYYKILDDSVKQAAVEFAYGEKNEATLLSTLKTLKNTPPEGPLPNEKYYLFRKYGSNDALVTIENLTDKINTTTNILADMQDVKFDSEKGYDMVLELTPAIEIPNITKIIFAYIFIYLGSSVAFAWFGLIEYLQKENNLNDNDLLFHPYRIAKEHAFRIKDVDFLNDSPTPLYFKFCYDPGQSPPVILDDPSGPYVENYEKRLKYIGPDVSDSNFHVWMHQTMINRGTNAEETPAYTAKLKYDHKELQELMYKAAYQELSRITESNTSKNH